MLRMIPGVADLPPVEMKHFLMSEAWYIMNFCRRVRLSISMFILQRLLRSVREKRRDLWESNTWLLHHDNAPAHTKLSIRKVLADKNSAGAPPPICQILLHVTFFLFPLVKNMIKETHFSSTDAIAVRSFGESSKSH